MWLIAGLLLGATVLSFLTSFHTQLHGHLATLFFGVIAGGWLIDMAVRGEASAELWLLFGADLSLAVGTGTLAYRGIIAPAASVLSPNSLLVGATGIALSDLSPSGTVRVSGEQWSADSLAGDIARGMAITVMSLRGIRLEVVPEVVGALPDGLFELDGRSGAPELSALPSSGEADAGMRWLTTPR